MDGSSHGNLLAPPFLFEQLCEVAVAFAVNVGNAVAHQLVEVGVVEEIERVAGWNLVLLGKNANDSRPFHLQKSWIC